MTDEHDHEPGDTAPGDAPWGSTPPVVTLESEHEVQRRGIGGRAVAAVLGALLVVGGIGFAATQLGSDEGDPETAVEDLFEAISNEDVLGVLAALDPGERDALAGPVQDLVAELQRLEVLDDAFALDGVSGLDLAFEDLELRTEPVRDDLVRVHLVGGTATFAYDTDDLALGGFLIDTFDRFGVEYQGMRDRQTEEIGDHQDDFLVARNGPDGWRVSIGYTMAEAARLDAGHPLPTPDGALTPIGADTPEAALDGLVRAAVEADVAGVVARLSPAELGALQDYWELVAVDADVPHPDELGVEIDLRDLDLRSEVDGDRARVFVDGFDVGVTADGRHLDVLVAGDCITLSGDLEELDLDAPFGEGPVCADDVEAMFEESFESSGLDELGIEVPRFDPVRTPETAVIAQRVDGGWYVAPVSTGAEALVEGFRIIDRSHLESFVDLGEAFVESFSNPAAFGTTGQFGAPAAPPDLPPPGRDPFPEDPFGDAPRPGVSDEAHAAASWADLGDLVFEVTGDEAASACVLAALQDTASTSDLYWLARGYRYDVTPPPDTQELFAAALEGCAP